MRSPRALAFVLFLAVSACAKASTLHEEHPVSAGLARYASVAIETKLDGGSEKEAAGSEGRLTERVIEHLRAGKVFAKVDKADGSGDLAIKMTIVKASRGSSLNQLVGTMGDAMVDVRVDLLDAKDQRSLGSFQVHADSSRSSRMSVGGVDTQTGSNPLHRAVDAAADEIGSYLAGKK